MSDKKVDKIGNKREKRTCIKLSIKFYEIRLRFRPSKDSDSESGCKKVVLSSIN